MNSYHNMRGPKIESPIFIVGAPRSGTTLTAKIIGRHSRIFMPGETHYFEDIYVRRNNLGEVSEQESKGRILGRLMTIYDRYNELEDQIRIEKLFKENDVLLKELNNCNDHKDMLTRFMEIQAKSEGMMRWGNNVPRDIFYLREIKEFYPDAKIVICARDLRGFLYSYMTIKNVSTKRHLERAKRLYHPIVTTMIWKASIRQINLLKKLFSKNNFIIVKYEDLVTSPDKVVKDICDVIGEKYESDMLNVSASNSSEVESRNSNVGIFTKSISRWKDHLPTEHTYVAQKIAGKEMSMLGYSSEDVRVNPIKLLAVIISFPIAVIRGLYANRNTIGPVIPYVIRRVASLFNR